MLKSLPIDEKIIKEIAKKYPTPFYLYDEKGIRENARRLLSAFDWSDGFIEFFAVKANPNPYIVKILQSEGLGVDCSSHPELHIAKELGYPGDHIMFTSNNTPAEEYKFASELGAIINLDDISHLPYLEKYAGLPKFISFRYNPGELKTGNFIIGKPLEAKFGFTRDQLFEGYKAAAEKGIKSFGIHTMVASNELDYSYFIETAEILFNLVAEMSKELNIKFDLINLGGGIGIPYAPEEKELDFKAFSEGIKDKYETIIKANNLDPIKLSMECGRFLTGPNGIIVSKVRHLKSTYKNFVGLDASTTNLIRPAMYGSYHHLTVLDKEIDENLIKYDVTGSLCEDSDKFGIDRYLPEVEVGDLVVIHDTGAHGYAMGYNYNGKLKSSELLLRENGDVEMIRRAETMDDYFRTVDFNGLKSFNV